MDELVREFMEPKVFAPAVPIGGGDDTQELRRSMDSVLPLEGHQLLFLGYEVRENLIERGFKLKAGRLMKESTLVLEGILNKPNDESRATLWVLSEFSQLQRFLKR